MKTSSLAFFYGLFTIPASAVIVGGVNGDGINNAGETTLQNYLVSASAPAFPYWGNVVRYSDASGIYLGYNATTSEGWLLTANHVTPSATGTVGIAGITYTITGSSQVVTGGSGTEFRLVKFKVGGSDPIPTLPTVVLTNTATLIGDSVILIGRGFKDPSDMTAPYTWGTPGTDDAVPIRWGSNIVAATNLPISGNTYFATDFTAPGGLGGTEYDGQGALGDSGGGAFALKGGNWVLAGGLGLVGDGPDGDSVANPAGYGDLSYGADVFLSRSDIVAITGTLVPEPSSPLLFFSSFFALVIRRRR